MATSGLIARALRTSPMRRSLPDPPVLTPTQRLREFCGTRGGSSTCDTEELGKDIDFAVFPVMQGGPMMHTIAGKAVCFGQASKPEFAQYAHQVVENCQVLATGLSEAGMRLVSGGTDNHLLLVDVTPLGITGRQAEQALEGVGIIANKNAIPFDSRPPRVTSGLRLGTPAITSRGMGTAESAQVASMVARVLTNIGDMELQRQVGEEVQELTSGFPVPGIDD
ncbi:Serine hydroxymethyltransferase [Geodia barretti]|nr:Serine hydroxymethyltransferase [Geodia barretti]